MKLFFYVFLPPFLRFFLPYVLNIVDHDFDILIEDHNTRPSHHLLRTIDIFLKYIFFDIFPHTHFSPSFFSNSTRAKSVIIF